MSDKSSQPDFSVDRVYERMANQKVPEPVAEMRHGDPAGFEARTSADPPPRFLAALCIVAP